MINSTDAKKIHEDYENLLRNSLIFVSKNVVEAINKISEDIKSGNCDSFGSVSLPKYLPKFNSYEDCYAWQRHTLINKFEYYAKFRYFTDFKLGHELLEKLSNGYILTSRFVPESNRDHIYSLYNDGKVEYAYKYRSVIPCLIACGDIAEEKTDHIDGTYSFLYHLIDDHIRNLILYSQSPSKYIFIEKRLISEERLRKIEEDFIEQRRSHALTCGTGLINENTMLIKKLLDKYKKQ